MRIFILFALFYIAFALPWFPFFRRKQQQEPTAAAKLEDGKKSNIFIDKMRSLIKVGKPQYAATFKKLGGAPEVQDFFQKVGQLMERIIEDGRVNTQKFIDWLQSDEAHDLAVSLIDLLAVVIPGIIQLTISIIGLIPL